MRKTNQDKEAVDPELEAVLEETPPDINEPQVESDIPEDERLSDPDNEEPIEEVEEEVEIPEPEIKEEIVEEEEETTEQKEQRYKAQQTEAQIQAERNKAFIDKVDEADNLPAPTETELRAFLSQDGVDWDELTTLEQVLAKKAYISEKKANLISQAVQGQKKIDEWAKSVDTFIDDSDGKPEYIDLSSHEADFRKFAMKESHRGTPIDILLSAFLHNLPPTKKTRGSLFQTGGGGEKIVRKEGITDAETAAKLRRDDPKEYKRQVKAGKIKIDI